MKDWFYWITTTAYIVSVFLAYKRGYWTGKAEAAQEIGKIVEKHLNKKGE